MATHRRKQTNCYSASKRSVVLATAMGLASAFGMKYLLQAEFAWYPNSILSLLLFAMFTVLSYGAVLRTDRRLTRISFVLGALFSVMIVLGTNLQDSGYPDMPGYAQLGTLSTYLAIIGLVPLCWSVSVLVIRSASAFAEKSAACDRTIGRAWPFWQVWLAIFIAWVPLLLVAFPGVYGYDSSYQVAQVLTDIPVTVHHPPLHTLLLGGLVALGNQLLGSYEAGLACYSIVQMAIMSSIFAYVCMLIRKLRAPKWLFYAAWVYFALFPINALFAISATKDVLFAGFCMLVIGFAIEAISDKKTFFDSRLLQVRLVAAIVAMLLFRNNGLYAFVLFAPFFVFALRDHWKPVAAIMVMPLALYAIVTGPVFSLFSVQPSSQQGEMLSIPLEQISRVLNTSEDRLTQEEKDWIKELVPLWEYYDARISDNAKTKFDMEEFKDNLQENVENYVAIGLRLPGEYVNQFLDITYGSWFPGKIFRDKAAYHPYILYDTSYGLGRDEPETIPGQFWIHRQSFFPELDKVAANFFYECAWQRVPVVSMLFSPGFMFWTLLMTLAILLYRKKYRLMVPLIFAFAIWFSCLFGPLVQPRYLYVLFLAFPLEAALALAPLGLESSKKPLRTARGMKN